MKYSISRERIKKRLSGSCEIHSNVPSLFEKNFYEKWMKREENPWRIAYCVSALKIQGKINEKSWDKWDCKMVVSNQSSGLGLRLLPSQDSNHCFRKLTGACFGIGEKRKLWITSFGRNTSVRLSHSRSCHIRLSFLEKVINVGQFQLHQQLREKNPIESEPIDLNEVNKSFCAVTNRSI